MATIIHCFLFTWKGQYENALKIEASLKDRVKLTVINSDDDNKPEHWINIGNDCYFSDQFRKALELFEGDILWHIQADATYHNWDEVLHRAENIFRERSCGVYAPNVDDTFYVPHIADIFEITDKLVNVSTTDCICWFLSKEIVDEVIKYSYLMNNNVYGWGWDLIACGLSHIMLKGVIRDYNVCVNHPKSTGYKKEEAEKEMRYMIMRCPPELQKIIYEIKVEPYKIKYLYFPHLEQDNLIRVYRT